MKIKGKLLSCVAILSFVILLLPTTALGAVGDTYTRTNTITSGGTYLLAGDIYALDRSTFSLTTNQGTQALTALTNPHHSNIMAEFGNRYFTINGTTLTQTTSTYADDTLDAYYRYTITSSGTSDGANPGYYIQRSGSYLDLYQNWTGLLYPITGETYEIGTSGQYVDTIATVTDPITRLSSTPRIWFWNGSNFYTRYTSDLTSIGQLIAAGNGFWSGSYLLFNGDGWSYINWDGINDRSYDNETFHLAGGYTSNQQYYAWFDMTLNPEMTYETQYGYRGSALYVSSAAYAYSSIDASGLGFQRSPLSLYKLNLSYNGATINITVDGSTSNIKAGSTVALYQTGTSKYSGTIASGGTSFTFPSAVLEGVYDIRIDGIDTGVDLNVNAENSSATVDYHTLLVSGGSGTGNYLAGQSVSISAIVPAGKVFSHWTSLPSLAFASATNKDTTFTMPTTVASVTAQFVDATYTINAAKQSGATSVVYGYTDGAGDIVVRITNTGNSPITGLAANVTNLTGTAFFSPASLSSTTLAVGATMDITVDFATGKNAGSYTGTLQFTGDNGANASYSLSQTVGKQTISLALTSDSSTVNAFDDPILKATISDAVGEVPRGTVTFKRDGITIASGCAITAAAGIITATTTWNDVPAGNYNLTAEYVAAAADNYTTTAAATLNGYVVNKINQTGFGFTTTGPIDKTFNDPNFDIEATGGQSTGAISYEVTAGSGYINVGTTSGEVTILAAGSATITATRAGDSNYNAATATMVVNVAKAANTLEVTCDDIQYGQVLTPGLNVTNTSGGTLSYLYEGTGTTAYVSTTPPVQVGTYKITISSQATENYLTATDDTTFSINKATPILTLSLNPTSIHGGGTVTATLTATNPYDDTLIAGLPSALQLTFSDSSLVLQSFLASGQDGVYTADLTIMNASAEATIIASFIGNECYLAADDDAILTVTFAANAADDRIVGIASGADYTKGITKRFDAFGSGVRAGSPLEGDTRYIPSTWSVGPLSGSWNLPEFSILPLSLDTSLFNASIDTSKLPLGTNTLAVVFELQRFDGEIWQSLQEVDTKTVSFALTETVLSTDNGNQSSTSTIPGTGDDSGWLWILMGLLGLTAICGALVLKARKQKL